METREDIRKQTNHAVARMTIILSVCLSPSLALWFGFRGLGGILLILVLSVYTFLLSLEYCALTIVLDRTCLDQWRHKLNKGARICIRMDSGIYVDSNVVAPPYKAEYDDETVWMVKVRSPWSSKEYVPQELARVYPRLLMGVNMYKA